jgi:membrane fusion protein (multidrug efflux system)
MKKSAKQTIIVLGVISVLAALVIIKIFTGGDDKTQNRPGRAGEAVSVDALIIRPEILHHEIKSTGTAMADEEVSLRTETGGRVISINFREGAAVSKGDLLLKINDAELQARLKKVELEIELAEEMEYRQRKLLEKEGVSREEYDKTLSRLNTLKADRDLIAAGIDKTEVRAPFDGIIGLRKVSPGAYISTGTGIARLVRMRPLKIEFSVPQKYSAHVSAGDTVEFQSTKKAERYIAEIYAIEPKIDPETRMLAIRAIFSNRNKELLPGAYVDLNLILDEIEDALMIPTQALVPGISGEFVYLYKNGKAAKQIVKIGIRTPERVQIVEGLAPGDTLISSGIIQLRPGIPVQLATVK